VGGEGAHNDQQAVRERGGCVAQISLTVARLVVLEAPTPCLPVERGVVGAGPCHNSIQLQLETVLGFRFAFFLSQCARRTIILRAFIACQRRGEADEKAENENDYGEGPRMHFPTILL